VYGTGLHYLQPNMIFKALGPRVAIINIFWRKVTEKSEKHILYPRCFPQVLQFSR
jgi:hypothetical protein